MVDHNTMQGQITRRAALVTGAGFLLPLAGQCAIQCAAMNSHADLFVFRTPDSDRLVIAVTFNDQQNRWKVRLHAGARSWMVNSPATHRYGGISRLNNIQVFAGQVLSRNPRTQRKCSAVVLETSHASLSARKALDVWAEILAEDGSRLRVASPLIAEILASDPLFSRTYHKMSPSQDRDHLVSALAKHVEQMAAAEGCVANPRAHGQRLANLLLPDVLRYRPDLPVGFNFASQNGRHPADDTASVVSTILTGSATRREPSAPVSLRDAFPYFELPT